MQTSTLQLEESPKGQVLIPLIRAAAAIGFTIAPGSLGFVIIAVSEHLIRSIMVGNDPEILMSDLQNDFPNDTRAPIPSSSPTYCSPARYDRPIVPIEPVVRQSLVKMNSSGCGLTAIEGHLLTAVRKGFS